MTCDPTGTIQPGTYPDPATTPYMLQLQIMNLGWYRTYFEADSDEHAVRLVEGLFDSRPFVYGGFFMLIGDMRAVKKWHLEPKRVCAPGRWVEPRRKSLDFMELPLPRRTA